MPPDQSALQRAGAAARILARALPPLRHRGLLSAAEVGSLSRSDFEQACRSLASPVYLGGGVALCRILGRHKFYVHGTDRGFGSNILLDGYWEAWLTQFIARLVKPGWTCVDVGANYGYYTLLMADIAGAGGHVYAVEPNPAAAALLRQSVDLNGYTGWTTICEVAAGARDGEGTLLVPRGEPKNAALAADHGDAQFEGERHHVPVRSIAGLVARGRPVDFIKVDAEGGEEAIIAGLAPVFAAGPPLMVLEFNAARYADPAAFLGQLQDIYGALRYVHTDGRAAHVSAERVLGEHFGEDWLLFLSPK